MSKIIGFAGKGGTGKTAVTSLIIEWLVKEKKTPVLAIDADPNSNLAQNLGVKHNQGIVQIVDEFSGGRKDIPGGASKESFFEYKVQDILNEADGFDLLSMGRPEGPGCYCYVNNILRTLMEKLTKSYTYTVIDNEAGMEHLSRRTTGSIDILFIISDETPVGMRSAKRIYDLAKELNINVGRAYLIVNRATNLSEEAKNRIGKIGIKLAGIIPQDEELYKLSVESRPIAELGENSIARKAVNDICRMLINRI